tara:strand:+ start:706 stop:1287 length:582 start_codon:yes stop_codon:yes gene_type:complete
VKLYKQGKGYNLPLKGINFMWKISEIRRSSKDANNIKKAIIILLVFVLGFISASFFTSQHSKNLHSQKATSPSFSAISEDKNESIYIISPKDGDQVTNPVRIIFGLKSMGVAPAGTIKKNTGHHHLLINLDELPDLKFPLPLNKNLIHFGLGQTETEVRLKKGINTLQLILGDHMHKPHQPPLISKKVKIIVK